MATTTEKKKKNLVNVWELDRSKQIEYLVSKGWKEDGKDDVLGEPMFWDSMGSMAAPVSLAVKELPVSSNITQTLYQKHGPIMPWLYKMKEALEIQEIRDKTPSFDPIEKFKEEQRRKNIMDGKEEPVKLEKKANINIEWEDDESLPE